MRMSAACFFRVRPRVAASVRQAGTAWVSLVIRDFIWVLLVVGLDSR